MRKAFNFISLVIFAFILLSLSGCSAPEKVYTEEDLTSTDLAYIDTVYESINWDATEYDGGSEYTIDRIKFFDFDGTLSFFVNYPIAGYRGYGVYVYSDTIEPIGATIYEVDTNRRLSSCMTNNAVSGTVWDPDASDTEKYETVKSAYIKYLNDNKSE